LTTGQKGFFTPSIVTWIDSVWQAREPSAIRADRLSSVVLVAVSFALSAWIVSNIGSPAAGANSPVTKLAVPLFTWTPSTSCKY
jgi:hypothetical protein